jgi:three-Cys-motif partner protein
MPQEKVPLASDDLHLRETGPWVHDKNFYVDRYLSIFSRGVSKKWKGKLAYVDFFAGPGRNIVRSSGHIVDGSPFLALRHSFAKYVFVDMPEVLQTLKARLARHPKRDRVTLIPGDCNTVVDEVRQAVPANYLTLVFIDPPGIQIRFETIRRLVYKRKVDLLMTVQFGMGIRMNLRQYSRSESEALTAFLGNTQWRKDYREIGSISEIGRRILHRYLGQLRELGYRTVRDREIYVHSDQKNLLLYLIVLASRHQLGGKYWRAATEVSPSGQKRLGLVFEE